MLSSKEIADIVNEPSNIERIEHERIRYQMFNGNIREYIYHAIVAEFKLPETVKQLVKRIVPLNLIQKIVKKLAMVYRSPPSRSPALDLESDKEFISLYEKETDINAFQKLLNRYFKLSKHAAIESYVNEQGAPALQVLAAHQFTPISDSKIDPTLATYMVKHISWGKDKKSQVHIVWSDAEHYTMDGMGKIIESPDEKENPYGVMPIIHVKETLDRLIPVEDDDLVSMQVAICLLLTDLSLGMKYRLWGIIYIIGAKGDKFSFNPNSVLYLPRDSKGELPQVGSIRPEFNATEALQMVETLVGMLLSTKSLKPGSVTGNLSTQNASSGIAKMLDEAEVTEDKQDQVAFFIKQERELFAIVRTQMNIWGEAGMLNSLWMPMRLSEDFELQIRFPDMKPVQTEKEIVETESLKLETKLTTHKRAVMSSNPELTEEEADELMIQIAKESKLKAEVETKATEQVMTTVEENSPGTKIDLTIKKDIEFSAVATVRDKSGIPIDVSQWKFSSNLFEIEILKNVGEIKLYISQEKTGKVKNNSNYTVQATNADGENIKVLYGKALV